MRATAFEGFIFVIDTDTYAGNFERPMCAYMTGRVGECGVGEEFAEMFKHIQVLSDGSYVIRSRTKW